MDNREKPKPSPSPEARRMADAMIGRALQPSEADPHKNARADAWQDSGRPWAWHLFAMGALLSVVGAASAHGPAFLVAAFAFLALAELVLIRDAAERRASWPPTSPPVAFGASPDELAIAWAKIACECQAQGEAIRASDAWRRSGMSWAKDSGQ